MKTGGKEVISEAHGMLKLLNEDLKALPDREWMMKPMLRYFERIEDGFNRELPMVWHYLTLSQEPLRAMDLTLFSPEFAGGVFSMLSMAIRYIDLAGEHMPDHICVLNRFPVGLTLSGDTIMPDLMVYAAANPCDASLISYSALEHHLPDIPFFFLDIPPLGDHRTQTYVARQIRRMVSFVEEKLSLKMDGDRFREVIDLSNQALSYQAKLLEFQKRTPCPIPSVAHILHGYANLSLPGDAAVVNWFADQYERIGRKIETGQGAVAHENIRLAWIANNIDFDLSIYEWLETEYGAVSVVCAMSLLDTDVIDINGSDDDIYEGLAKRTMNFPMPRNGRGQINDYVDRCVQMVNDYHADAVVFAANIGCKYHWAGAQLIKEKLKEKLNKPILAFDLSPWDERVRSSDQIKEKFEQFFDMVLG